MINDLSAAGTIDLSGTSAIGSLTALRAQCRGAKERLSTDSVTSLVADVPGHRSEVRLTRNELDDAIRQPVADFAGVLQDTLQRNGVRELAAVASVGGGARIPIITTTLSEHFRVPVITSGQPELAAAIGGGLAAVRGTVDGRADLHGRGRRPSAAARDGDGAGGGGAADEMAPSGTFGALAWSDADDVPDVAPTDPYDYESPADSGRRTTCGRRCSSSTIRMTTSAQRGRCRGTADPRSRWGQACSWCWWRWRRPCCS